jgi:hypothetical protein
VLVTSVRVVRTYDKGSGSRARRQEGSSVATTKQQLPPFVVDGEYEDHEWREIAADPEKQTKRNQPRYVAGPLQHPYGKSAYLDEKPVGDEVIRRWFPSREERDKYVNTHEAGEPQLAEPGAMENTPLQARAQRRGIEATPRDKARTGTPS